LNKLNIPPQGIKISTQTFTGQKAPDTPPKTMWNNIRRFCGLNPQKHIHSILNPHTSQHTINKSEIAELFSTSFSNASLDHNFSATFVHAKQALLINIHSHSPAKRALEIEKQITLIDFTAALNNFKGNTPGLDRINYSMLKTKTRIINLQNEILKSHIPPSYKYSIIIPIPKPHSDNINPH